MNTKPPPSLPLLVDVSLDANILKGRSRDQTHEFFRVHIFTMLMFSVMLVLRVSVEKVRTSLHGYSDWAQPLRVDVSGENGITARYFLKA